MFNKNQRSVVKTNEILYTKYSPKDHDSIFPLHVNMIIGSYIKLPTLILFNFV